MVDDDINKAGAAHHSGDVIEVRNESSTHLLDAFFHVFAPQSQGRLFRNFSQVAAKLDLDFMRLEVATGGQMSEEGLIYPPLGLQGWLPTGSFAEYTCRGSGCSRR